MAMLWIMCAGLYIVSLFLISLFLHISMHARYFTLKLHQKHILHNQLTILSVQAGASMSP